MIDCASCIASVNDVFVRPGAPCTIQRECRLRFADNCIYVARRLSA